jgi:hypothetical protein
MYRLILLVLLALQASAAWSRCVHEGRSVRFGTLQVETCLWTDAVGKKPPIVTELRETLENVSDRPITLELAREPLRRYLVGIYGGGKTLSAELAPPVLHGPNTTVVQPREAIRLEPGESTRLTVAFAALMKEPAVRKQRYRIAVTHDYPWRFEDEPAGSAFQRRNEQSNRERTFPEVLWFEGVRLK